MTENNNDTLLIVIMQSSAICSAFEGIYRIHINRGYSFCISSDQRPLRDVKMGCNRFSEIEKLCLRL